MERLRRTAREILGYESRLYRSGATALDFLSTVKSDGYSTWRALGKSGEGNQGNPLPNTVTLRNLEYPLLVRPGTEDAGTVVNNVIREEYGKVRPFCNPNWMIDAGAYIGDTSAYFLSRFPDLRVVALEPNPPSHEMARQNLNPYGTRAILLQCGLSSVGGTARFSGDDTSASIVSEGQEIECVTILSLLEQYAIPRVDILKLDIEGAEEAIFMSHPEAWLSRVDMLIIEIHPLCSY